MYRDFEQGLANIIIVGYVNEMIGSFNRFLSARTVFLLFVLLLLFLPLLYENNIINDFI